jgi:hypothetical protein
VNLHLPKAHNFVKGEDFLSSKMRFSCALIAVFAASANGYQFIPSRGGPVVENEEPVVGAPAAIVQVGPRPYYLVDKMKPSFLKDQLSKYEP